MRSFGPLLIAALLSAQAFAWADVQMTCRYSGRTLKDCPCPPSESRQDALERLDCCLVRATHPIAVIPVVPVRLALLQEELAALPPVVGGSALAIAPGDLPSPHALDDPPPPLDRRRFLLLRHLLI